MSNDMTLNITLQVHRAVLLAVIAATGADARTVALSLDIAAGADTCTDEARTVLLDLAKGADAIARAITAGKADQWRLHHLQRQHMAFRRARPTT